LCNAFVELTQLDHYSLCFMSEAFNPFKMRASSEAVLSKGDGNEERFTFKSDVERNPSLEVLLELAKKHTF